MSRAKKTVEERAGTRTCELEDLRAALIGQVVHPYIEGQNLQSERQPRPDAAPGAGPGHEDPPRA